MKHYKLFSLSIQKQFQNKNIHMEPEVDRAFNELNFRTLLKRSSIKKLKGFRFGNLLLVDFIAVHQTKNELLLGFKIFYKPS